MAILDRPLFQRRLTTNQLRGYGLPAFANGGIVKKFAEGGPTWGEVGSAIKDFFTPDMSKYPYKVSDKPIYQIGGPLTRDQYDMLNAETIFNIYYKGAAVPTTISPEARPSIRPGAMGIVDKERITSLPGAREPISGLEFQETAIKQLSEEQQKEAKKALVGSDIKKVEEEISLIEETIKYKKDNNLDTSEDEKLLKNKKSQLDVLEDTAKTGVDVATIDAEEKKRLAPRARDIKVKKEQDAIAEGQSTLADAGLGDTGGERERLMNLENLVQERSELYKKIIGDPKEAMKQQGFLQLAQFGLNLAAARGGNLAEKIARSAADPLQTFAALAQQAVKDERAIDLLAIEASEEELARADDEDKAGALGQIAEAFKIAEPGKSQAYYMNKAIDFSNAKSGKSQQEIIYELADTVFNKRVDSNPEYTFPEAVAEITDTMGLDTVTGQGGGTEWDEVEVGGVFVGDDGKQYRKTGSAYTAENIELIG
jgi:hypothetical protein